MSGSLYNHTYIFLRNLPLSAWTTKKRVIVKCSGIPRSGTTPGLLIVMVNYFSPTQKLGGAINKAINKEKI